jgi:hypothetical protein
MLPLAHGGHAHGSLWTSAWAKQQSEEIRLKVAGE